MNWVEIGSRIRKQRELFGFTREAFAEKLEVTPKFCSDIELGLKGMSVPTLCKISSILHLPTDYILFGTNQTEAPLPISLMLQRCTPTEAKYAEELLRTYLIAIDEIKEK